jgi:hypothetical protein
MRAIKFLQFVLLILATTMATSFCALANASESVPPPPSQSELADDEEFQRISVRQKKLDDAFVLLVNQEMELASQRLPLSAELGLQREELNARRTALDEQQRILNSDLERCFQRALGTESISP